MLFNIALICCCVIACANALVILLLVFLWIFGKPCDDRRLFRPRPVKIPKHEWTRAIDEAMVEIGFVRIAHVMQELDWTYMNSDKVEFHPDSEYLATKAYQMCNEAVSGCIENSGKQFCVSTGGFEVSAEVVNGKPFVRIMFVVEDSGDFSSKVCYE